MSPDTLRDALLAAAASALLFAALKAIRRRARGEPATSRDDLAAIGSVAVAVFVVVFTLPMWHLGADEVLPPPFTPAR